MSETINQKKLNIININLNFKDPFNVSKTSASNYVKSSLDFAHDLAKKKLVKGFINCPISKQILPKNNGVTEYLAFKCNIKNNSEVMLIKSKKLSVVPITTHINIDQITKKLNYQLIKNKINTLNNWFKNYRKKTPNISVLGLNPHNAEFKKILRKQQLLNLSLQIKKRGMKIYGPFVADTIFIKNYLNYDV